MGNSFQKAGEELKKKEFNKDKKQFIGKAKKWKLETIIRKSKTNIVKLNHKQKAKSAKIQEQRKRE